MKIAISGLSGSGNSTACAIVGKALKLKVVNYTFRNMADEMGLPLGELQERRKEDESYDYLLDRKQMELFRKEKDAVLGSRLAIWLADANLRVWLDAPLKTRAERIAERERISFAEAFEVTRKRDAENAAAYGKLYGIDVADHGFADLTLNAGRLDAKGVAGKIITAAKGGKFAPLKKSPFSASISGKIGAGLEKLRC